MTNTQESLSNMHLAMIMFCDANEEIAKILPMFIANLTRIKNNNAQIRIISEQQKLGLNGATKGKSQLRAQTIVLAADTARKLTAYATFNNNHTLLGAVNYSESKFKRFTDQEVRDYAHIIYEQAQPLVESLTEYAITPDTQGDLSDAIESFNLALADPRYQTTIEVQATAKLKALFNDTKLAIAQMDKAVEIIRLTKPDFYKGYKTARKVIRKGVVRLSLKAKVTDSVTGELLKNVIVSFALEGRLSKLALIKKTAAKGGFSIKSLAAGTYQVTFTKAGYIDQVITINITDGEMTLVAVKMVMK
jgi:hypothetical protein